MAVGICETRHRVLAHGRFEVFCTVVSKKTAPVSDDTARHNSQIGKIINGDEPCIAGTAVTVRSIKACATAGFPMSEILSRFPMLDMADVHAAIEYEFE
jgi:uncharacterized protein (DUF433 family)